MENHNTMMRETLRPKMRILDSKRSKMYIYECQPPLALKYLIQDLVTNGLGYMPISDNNRNTDEALQRHLLEMEYEIGTKKPLIEYLVTNGLGYKQEQDNSQIGLIRHLADMVILTERELAGWKNLFGQEMMGHALMYQEVIKEVGKQTTEMLEKVKKTNKFLYRMPEEISIKPGLVLGWGSKWNGTMIITNKCKDHNQGDYNGIHFYTNGPLAKLLGLEKKYLYEESINFHNMKLSWGWDAPKFLTEKIFEKRKKLILETMASKLQQNFGIKEEDLYREHKELKNYLSPSRNL